MVGKEGPTVPEEGKVKNFVEEKKGVLTRQWTFSVEEDRVRTLPSNRCNIQVLCKLDCVPFAGQLHYSKQKEVIE